MEHKDSHKQHGGHHLVPLSVYFNTLIALVILTVITVGASYIDFGKANIFVSLGIATAKAALVMMFFMGLKYDNNLNRGFILSSFVALGLLLFFCAADLWTRLKPDPIKIKAMAALSVEDFKKAQISTPDLVAKGKTLFETNCTTCHGIDGKGNGIASATLNPKPRNFSAPVSEWKNGTSNKAIYVTLAYGIPGSGMAAYKSLPVEDRWALIHYIRTFGATVEASSKGDAKFEVAMKEDGIGGEGGPKATIPVDFAIQRMAK